MNRTHMDAHRAQDQTARLGGWGRVPPRPSITGDDVVLAFRAGGCKRVVMHHDTLVVGETPAGIFLRASVTGDAWRVRGTTPLRRIEVIDHELSSLATLGELVASVDRHAALLGVK